MNRSAHVTSTTAVERVRVALRQFDDEARVALTGLDLAVRRVTEWLTHDQPSYWKRQILKSWEQLAEARAAFERCRAVTVAGHRASCQDEKEAVARAKKRVEFCEAQAEVVRGWSRTFQHEVFEFERRVRELHRCLDGDIPRAIRLVEKLTESLEAYLAACVAPRKRLDDADPDTASERVLSTNKSQHAPDETPDAVVPAKETSRRPPQQSDNAPA